MAFVVVFTLVLKEFVNYDVLFRRSDPLRSDFVKGGKIYFSDIFLPFTLEFSLSTWICLLVAAIFFCTKALATVYHFFQYWDIKSFYNVALKIEDHELKNVDWNEVQRRLSAAQADYQMCIHKDSLTELDIYHRILRFKNYLVAMTNKSLIPAKFNVPLIGQKLFLSQGLKFNLEFLLFNGPWAPFNQWHLKDDYRKVSKKKELVDFLQSKITLIALLNLAFMPLILLWQMLNTIFSYAELIKRRPDFFAQRKWSPYAQLYLRHFNELDHELRARLNRAYKPATKYLDLFSNPLSVVIAKAVAFMAGAVLAVLILLTSFDEDVIQVEHMITLMTVLSVAVVACYAFVPDDNLVFNPEKSLTGVLAHIHYFPDAWKGRAHTDTVVAELGELFPFTFEHIVYELFSPILTPFVLFLCVRPRAPQIVDFFRNFTVDVVGVGDVCSFAQMDVKRHGNLEWQNAVTAGINGAESPAKNTNQYTQAEDGKTEMSLVHFALTNPDWQPPEAATQFMTALRGHAAKDAETLATVREEENPGESQIGEENPLFNSLNSLEAAGGIYSSLATNMLGDVRHCRITNQMTGQQGSSSNVEESQTSSGMTGSNSNSFGSGPSSLMESVHFGLATNRAGANGGAGGGAGGNLGRSSMTTMMMSSHFSANLQPPSLMSSRLVGSTLAPPPNPARDLRRLGLEYTDADMSLSALYLHELHHRGSNPSAGATSGNRRGGPGGVAGATRYDFSARTASLNELDEENLPLVEVESQPPRLTSSFLS